MANGISEKEAAGAVGMIYFLMSLFITTLAVVFGFVAFLLPAAAIGEYFGLGWGIIYTIVAVSIYIYKAETFSW